MGRMYRSVLRLGALLLAWLGLAASGAAAGVTFTADKAVIADPARYTMQTERPAYDARADHVRVNLFNHTREETAYGQEFRLQLQKADGTWSDVPFEDPNGKSVPAIATILPAGGSTREVVSLTGYGALAAGRYRIIQELGTQEHAAEFTLLASAGAPALTEPLHISLTSAEGARTGAVTLSKGDQYDYQDALPALWSELLAFRRTTPPQAWAEASPAMQVKWVGTNKKSVRLSLYELEGRTWMNMDQTKKNQSGGQWYSVADGGVISRLLACVEELGGYLPQTGDALIAALTAKEPLRSAAFEEHTFTLPFELDGWLSNRDATGINLSILRFPSATALNRQMRYVTEDGYAIGREKRAGGAVSFGYERIDWAAPPHYFKCGALLVLYLGDDAAVLESIAATIGPQAEVS